MTYQILLGLIGIDILLNIFTLKKIIENKNLMEVKELKDKDTVDNIIGSINRIIDIIGK